MLAAENASLMFSILNVLAFGQILHFSLRLMLSGGSVSNDDDNDDGNDDDDNCNSDIDNITSL